MVSLYLNGLKMVGSPHQTVALQEGKSNAFCVPTTSAVLTSDTTNGAARSVFSVRQVPAFSPRQMALRLSRPQKFLLNYLRYHLMPTRLHTSS